MSKLKRVLSLLVVGLLTLSCSDTSNEGKADVADTEKSTEKEKFLETIKRKVVVFNYDGEKQVGEVTIEKVEVKISGSSLYLISTIEGKIDAKAFVVLNKKKETYQLSDGKDKDYILAINATDPIYSEDEVSFILVKGNQKKVFIGTKNTLVINRE